MQSDETPDPLALVGSGQVAFDYIKGQLFRVVHVDGVVGSVTNAGNIHMAVFSERPPIPRRAVFSLNPDGTLGEVVPEAYVARQAIVREVDVDIQMSLETAKAMCEWLTQRIAELTAIRNVLVGEHK